MLHTAGYIRLGPRAVRADLAERLAGSLSQIRRGSETSAFAVPPELSALIGCPQADFPAILRALGLKPAEKDRETGAVKLWRFPARRDHGHDAHRRKGSTHGGKSGEGHPARPARLTPPPAGPFAVLADLMMIQPPQLPARPQRRRRRSRRQQAAPAPKAVS